MHLPLNTRPKTAAVLAGTAVLAAAGFVSARLRTRAAETRSPPAGRVLEVEGARCTFSSSGSGPDVLLIHGMAMMAAEMMLALGKAFPGQRVTAIDRPAHGHSGKRRRPSLERQVELLHAAVVELGLKKPVVVGHSLGGAVALAYGERFSDEVSGVVAVAPWPIRAGARLMSGAPFAARRCWGPLLSNTTLALADPAVLRAAVPLIFSPQKTPAGFPRGRGRGPAGAALGHGGGRRRLHRASFALVGLSKRYGSYPVPVHVVLGDKDHILKPARQGCAWPRPCPPPV
jgi:pimeloyl-ACP methyl ester carboxylesterase